MRVDDAAIRAGRRMRVRYDGQVPPALLRQPRRPGVVHALLTAIVVAVLVVGVVVVVSRDEAQQPANGRESRWDRVSMRRAFGADTVMADMAGAPWGFVAVGATPHRCIRGAPIGACQTSHFYYSEQGERWTEVSLPAVRLALSSVTLGRVGDRVLAVWTGPKGLAAWWSADGREWHRGNVRQARLEPESPQRFSTWAIGAWSGGVVASEIAGGLESWVSRDGSTWTHVPAAADPREPNFLWPQGVQVGNNWIGITGGVGVITNGASQGIPQIMRSETGRGWQPIDSNAPERVIPRLVPDATEGFAVATQFRIPGYDPQAVGLYRTRDGRRWTEIESFRQQFPAANPSQVAHSGKWWIVSGTNGPSGAQSTALWISRDLRRWDSSIQRPGRFGAPGMLATSKSTAVSIPSRGRWIRIIHLDADS